MFSGSSLFGQPQTTTTTGSPGDTLGTFGAQRTFGSSPPGAPPGGSGLFDSFGSPSKQQAATGGLFGSTQQPQTTAGGGLFGSSLFGSTTQTPTAGGLLGSSTGGGLFGSTQPQTTTSGLFGSSQPSGGLFGSTQQPQAASGGLFGSTQQPQAAGGGLFGSTQQPQAASGGLFGSTQQPQAASGGLFGSTQPSQAASGGSFGTTQPSQAAGGGLFGSTQPSQAAGGGLFGSTQQPQGGLFGSAPTSGGGLFGSAPQSSTGGLFSNTQQSTGGLFGTAQQGGGLLGAQQPVAGLFGSQGGSGGLFGAPASKPPGGSSLFGGTSTFDGRGIPASTVVLPPAPPPAERVLLSSAPSLADMCKLSPEIEGTALEICKWLNANDEILKEINKTYGELNAKSERICRAIEWKKETSRLLSQRLEDATSEVEEIRPQISRTTAACGGIAAAFSTSLGSANSSSGVSSSSGNLRSSRWEGAQMHANWGGLLMDSGSGGSTGRGEVIVTPLPEWEFVFEDWRDRNKRTAIRLQNMHEAMDAVERDGNLSKEEKFESIVAAMNTQAGVVTKLEHDAQTQHGKLQITVDKIKRSSSTSLAVPGALSGGSSSSSDRGLRIR